MIEYAPALSSTNWMIYDGPITNDAWFMPMDADAPSAGFFRLRMPTND